MSRICRVAFVILLIVAGCRSSDEPPSGTADGLEFLRCARPMDDGNKESVRIAPLELRRDGLDLKIQGLKSTLTVVGVLAGINEASRQNFANLDYFLAQFKEAGVQLIAVMGGFGTSEAETASILQHLAAAPVPILLVPGAEENFDVFRRVVKGLHKQAPQLVDMTRVRRVHIGRLTLVSLPGYHKPFYLAAKERGCGFQKKDVEETAELFDAKGTNVILSPTPPLGEGPYAVDRTRGEVNIGYATLRRVLDDQKIRFGIFGHVYESGGHAVQADGRTPARSGVWNESLWIQAGAAEALPMFLQGEGRARGMAQIVSFSADRARYQTVDISPR